MVIKNTRIPHEAVIIASCFYIIINVAVYVTLLIAAVAYFRIPLHATAALSVLSLPALLVSGLAVGIMIAPFSLLYLDLRYGISILSAILLWMTPILYVTPKEGLLSSFNRLNPLTCLIEIPRYWLMGGIKPDYALTIISISFFIALFFAALRFYRKSVPVLADAIL